ncbi:leucyl/phenylalanyl-tRNA--protein transferase [Luteimonas sp. XNQY3]|nr:leucyl/phenylalanyl-tRNA--protein transferase [Luteimonas sp. XNQY3]MCD9006868.1 leucyl/phenylalanyl-tRNA--protein transferase [Luteimonas sp. XNQY3]
MSLHLPRLGVGPDAPFPPVDSALRRPDGLLAFGGDLSVPRLRNAYRHGIFPWFSEGQPILWWSPDPRTVFDTATLRPNRRFARSLRGSDWTLRADTAFADVVTACAQAPRPGQDGTWITADMRDAYTALHAAGFAHSVEVFDGDDLVGGVYGVSIGRMFFGESMFSARTGTSKAALFGLARQMRRWHMPLIDAQVGNPHLASLGAASWPRERFIESVDVLAEAPAPVTGAWTGAFGEMPAAALGAPD